MFEQLIAQVSTTCTVNGQTVGCEPIGTFLGLIFGGFLIIWLAVVVILIVSLWKIYRKAGKPGWASIIPVYNIVVLLEMIGKPIWWVIFIFIPVVNMIFSVIVAYHLARAFGKDIGFAIGLMILPFIFYPILAFGRSTYVGNAPVAPQDPSPPQPAQIPPPFVPTNQQ